MKYISIIAVTSLVCILAFIALSDTDSSEAASSCPDICDENVSNEFVSATGVLEATCELDLPSTDSVSVMPLDPPPIDDEFHKERLKDDPDMCFVVKIAYELLGFLMILTI